MPFVPAVMISGWYGGFGPAVLALLLGAAAGNYLWQEPRYTFAVTTPAEGYSLGFFIGVSLVIAILTEILHVARWEAEKNAAALQDSERRFRLLVEQVPDYAIYLLDGDGRIVSWNPGAERLTGYSASEVLAQHVSLMYPPEDRRVGLAEQHLGTARETGSAEHEGWRPRKDGRPFWASGATSALRDTTGTLRGFATVVRDMTQRRQEEEEVRQSRAQLRELSTHLQQVLEQERTRVACAVHDELGQALTVLKIELSLLERDAVLGEPYLHQRVEEMSGLIDATVLAVRRIATELRPRVLDVLGLEAAIEWQAREFEARTGISCRLRLPPKPLALDAERSTALFRILQEALTNVIRHADASQVEIQLERLPEGCRLSIHDNGRGMSVEEEGATSLGFFGMRERAQVMNGTLTVLSIPGEGTTVETCLPLWEPGGCAI